MAKYIGIITVGWIDDPGHDSVTVFSSPTDEEALKKFVPGKVDSYSCRSDNPQAPYSDIKSVELYKVEGDLSKKAMKALNDQRLHLIVQNRLKEQAETDAKERAEYLRLKAKFERDPKHE